MDEGLVDKKEGLAISTSSSLFLNKKHIQASSGTEVRHIIILLLIVDWNTDSCLSHK